MSLDVVQIKNWVESLPSAILDRGLDKRIPIAVTIVAIAFLTQSLAQLTWSFIPVPDMPASSTAVSREGVNRQATPRRATSLAPQIAQMHLFGKFEKKKAIPIVAPLQDVATAPETKLNLKLRGVFASTNPKNASAIIADAKGQEESYKIGDDIVGRAILREVYVDKVILERNGRLETLKLPVETSPGIESASRSSRGGRRGLSPTNTALSPRNSAETSRLLRGYRDALINDPQSVMGLLRAEPFRKNGKLHGFRIRPGKDRQLLRKFGLRSGDVVTSINGVLMNNPLKALEVMRDLSTSTNLTVDIERRGVPQSFSFQIQ
ncbi:MAG: type II secretion system protein GspC [Thiohalomonadales bacterium]